MHKKEPDLLCRIPDDLSGTLAALDLPEELDLLMRRGESWMWIDRSASRLSHLATALKIGLESQNAHIRKDHPLHIVDLSFERMAAIIEEELRDDDSEFVEGGIARGRSVREFIFGEKDGEESPDTGSTALPAQAQRVISLCALEPFLDRGLRFLSTGELRRSLLARCMLARADLSILEELFDALDKDSRQAMRKALASWQNGDLWEADTSHTGLRTTTISIERDLSPLLPTFDHALIIDGSQILHTGVGDPTGTTIPEAQGSESDFTSIIRQLAAEAHAQEGLGASIFEDFDASTTPLVSLDKVNVGWGEHRVLQDLSWQIRAGEHWRLEGPNGSGKTTLLGLITGENTQAFSNEVRILGRKRGSGETIWDLKWEIGQVSWQLHREYRLVGDTRLDEVLASGLYDSIGLYRPMGDSTRMLARHWLSFAGFAGQEDRPFGSLDWGAQRVIIILRALIKLPRLLILDEPCQGLDHSSRRTVLDMLGEVLALGLATALHVTHDPTENIRGIRQVMSLCPGNIPMYRRELLPDTIV